MPTGRLRLTLSGAIIRMRPSRTRALGSDVQALRNLGDPAIRDNGSANRGYSTRCPIGRKNINRK